jgi:hypothetical protein
MNFVYRIHHSFRVTSPTPGSRLFVFDWKQTNKHRKKHRTQDLKVTTDFQRDIFSHHSYHSFIVTSPTPDSRFFVFGWKQTNKHRKCLFLEWTPRVTVRWFSGLVFLARSSRNSTEESDLFQLLHTVSVDHLKGFVGLILVKPLTMTISIPLDLCIRSFIPLPRFSLCDTWWPFIFDLYSLFCGS